MKLIVSITVKVENITISNICFSLKEITLQIPLFSRLKNKEVQNEEMIETNVQDPYSVKGVLMHLQRALIKFNYCRERLI